MSHLALYSVGAAAAASGTVVLERWNQKRISHEQRKQVRYIRLLPHANTSIDGEHISRMIEQFAGYKRTEAERWKKGREWFRFLVHKNKSGEIAFYFGYTEDRTTGIRRSLEIIYPQAELHDIRHEDLPLPNSNDESGYGGYFVLSEPGARSGLPLADFEPKRDHWPDILYTLDAGNPESEVWLDLSFSPSTTKKLKDAVSRTEKAIRPQAERNRTSNGDRLAEFGREVLDEFTQSGRKRTTRPQPKKAPSVSELDIDEQDRLRALRKRFSGREVAFDVAVKLYATGSHANSIAHTAATMITTSLRDHNGLRFVTQKKAAKDWGVSTFPKHHHKMLWTGSELANLLHLPDGKHRIYNWITHLKPGQRSFAKDEFSEGISFGTLNHPIQGDRPAKISEDTITKHFQITGKSGGGKSSLITEICQSMLDDWVKDPDNAPGFTFFDPAQETVLTILNRLLEMERRGAKIPWEKVHYGKLADTEYPIGMNILHNSSTEAAMALLKKVAPGSQTVRMDRLAFNAVETLIKAGGHNILGLLPLIQDESFRDRVVPKVLDDYFLNEFWTKQFENFQNGSDSSVEAFTNRLSPFSRNIDLRLMVGQSEWSIPIKKYMDEGHIFLIDFLNVDKTVKELAAEHLVTQYYHVAKTRPRGKRKLHILMIDESHLLQTKILQKLFAEIRKFGLSIGLITQYVEQYEPWLREEIKNNVGTVMACLQGNGSASTMSDILLNNFTAEQLERLPERTVAVKTLNNNNEPDFFMSKCDPPYVYLPDGRIARYKNEEDEEEFLRYTTAKALELQKRDWKSVAEVEQEINEYLRVPTLRQEMKTRSAPIISNHREREEEQEIHHFNLPKLRL